MGLQERFFNKKKTKKVGHIFITVLVVTALIISSVREKNIAAITGIAVLTVIGIYLYYNRRQSKYIVPLPVLYCKED